MKLIGFERLHILDALVTALTDRHRRLIERARCLLPSIVFSGFNINQGGMKEQQALYIVDVLLSHGFTVPGALELDNKSVYRVMDYHGDIQMTKDVADALWSAGFQDVNEPNEEGLTPILQNWYCANFPMIDWFVEKNVSLSSRHRDAPLRGLHFYAAWIEHQGFDSSHNLGAIPTDEQCMAQIQKEIGIPHDECTCPCSPNGCSPITFLFKTWPIHNSRRDSFRTWLKKVRPELSLVRQYVLEFTRCLIFEFLGCKHTCCVLGQKGNIKTWKHRKNHFSNCGREMGMRISKFQTAKLPQPCRLATSAEKAERREKILELYMSEYDEMPRPDSLLPEEQPFCYVNWIWERFIREH